MVRREVMRLTEVCGYVCNGSMTERTPAVDAGSKEERSNDLELHLEICMAWGFWR